MNYPYDQIENELIKHNWEIKEKTIPESVEMWFAKEIWEISRNSYTKFLIFLIDPQTEKQENYLWAISFTDELPKSRRESEYGELIPLNRSFIANLKGKLKTV